MVEDAVEMFGVAESIYPCAIIPARYGGTYEGVRWLAFPLHHEDIPRDAVGSDVPCAEWHADPTVVLGGGDTPNAALTALITAVKTCEPWRP